MILKANYGLDECPVMGCDYATPFRRTLKEHVEEHGVDLVALGAPDVIAKEVRTISSTGGQKGTKIERFDLIPAGPLAELAAHYGRGAQKYASHQWRQGYEWSKSIAAMGRHQNAFNGGEDYDVCPADESGCSFVTNEGETFAGGSTPHGRTCYNHTGSHHMAAVAWHAFLLLEFKDTHPGHDDRYKKED